MQTDRLTTMAKLIVAVRNFAKVPKTQKIQKSNKMPIQYTLQLIRPTLVLHPCCVLEQVIVNQKGVNKKTYSVTKKGLA